LRSCFELTDHVCFNSRVRKQLTPQRNSSLGLSARPGVPLFTSEVLFQRSACTCCMPRTCPLPKRSTDLNVAPDVDKAPSSTAFYFRCHSPKCIAIRSPFPSTWTSESSTKRRWRKAHILNREQVIQLKLQTVKFETLLVYTCLQRKSAIESFIERWFFSKELELNN
jgi:hypothetical protein